MDEIVKVELKWKHWHYKNTTLLVISTLVFFFLADTPYIRNFVQFLGGFGYISAFFVGILFVSIFTVAPASVMLFYLADTLNPLGVAIAAGTGGVLGDYLIFKYLKDQVFEELRPFFVNHSKPVRKLFKTPYFSWVVPIIGAIIIMSPFPDEVGIGLLGVSRIKTWQFLGLLYLLDISGVFLVVLAARAL